MTDTTPSAAAMANGLVTRVTQCIGGVSVLAMDIESALDAHAATVAAAAVEAENDAFKLAERALDLQEQLCNIQAGRWPYGGTDTHPSLDPMTVDRARSVALAAIRAVASSRARSLRALTGTMREALEAGAALAHPATYKADLRALARELEDK